MWARGASPKKMMSKKGLKKTRILLVDDHPIVRKGLSQLINNEPDLCICAEAEGGPEAITALEAGKCEMGLIDLSIKGGNGIDLVKSIVAMWPKFPTLVLSMHDEAIYAERALRAGARGYVMKQEATEKMMDAIRAVMRGEIYLSSKMNTHILSRVVEGASGEKMSVIDRLSDRELEVLTLIGHGLGTRLIAEYLHLSVKTVESHRAHLKEKLNIATAPELVRFGVEWVRSQEPV